MDLCRFVLNSLAVLGTPLGAKAQRADEGPIVGILTAAIQPHGFRNAFGPAGAIAYESQSDELTARQRRIERAGEACMIARGSRLRSQ